MKAQRIGCQDDCGKENEAMSDISAAAARPGHAALRISAGGGPMIEAYRCHACGAVVLEQTMACRACASRTPPEAFACRESGALWTWSVVQRSYPGVAVPFISAIVDLDDGLTLKGTVKGIDPADLRQGMKLALIYDDAGGAQSKDGAAYVGFHFVPAGDAP